MQFSIGDLVYFKVALEEMRWGESYPKPFLVVEHLAQTCPGGTQHGYAVRNAGDGVAALDIELLPAADPAVLAAIETYRASRDHDLWDMSRLVKKAKEKVNEWEAK